jgi:hypothetical protein
MSLLGWIDFSRSHKDRVMTVMDLFKEEGVIDELGLGTIRDSLSDLLFPGTSTIQTRAKYFLLIPWIFQDIEKKGRIDRFLTDLEELEIHFIKVLRQNNPGRFIGIIGGTLQNANPKRKPSSIYWNGLRKYNILSFPSSLGDYAKFIKHYQQSQKQQKSQLYETDGNVPGDDKDAHHLYQQRLWCSLPPPPPGWKEKLPIDLTAEEACFLQGQIIRSQGDSLWGYTLLHKADEALYFDGIDDFLTIPDLPEKHRRVIQLAVNFNVIMKGALIRYNYLIQADRENGWAEKALADWDNYWNGIKDFDWDEWDMDLLWSLCHTPITTKSFVHKWVELVQQPKYDIAQGDKLIKDRELRLKGVKRSKLYNKAVGQKQQTYTGISRADDDSIVYLRYRWNNVKTLLKDIQTALANVAA